MLVHVRTCLSVRDALRAGNLLLWLRRKHCVTPQCWMSWLVIEQATSMPASGQSGSHLQPCHVIVTWRRQHVTELDWTATTSFIACCLQLQSATVRDEKLKHDDAADRQTRRSHLDCTNNMELKRQKWISQFFPLAFVHAICGNFICPFLTRCSYAVGHLCHDVSSVCLSVCLSSSVTEVLWLNGIS